MFSLFVLIPMYYNTRWTILKNSPVILQAEVTTSLDIENELLVKQARTKLPIRDKTVVVIAHTLSIAKNTDQILMVKDRRIAESGTYEELIQMAGKYADM